MKTIYPQSNKTDYGEIIGSKRLGTPSGCHPAHTHHPMRWRPAAGKHVFVEKRWP